MAIDDPAARLYTRDPNGTILVTPTLPPTDLDAVLPAGAVDTGYRLGGSALWINEADDSFVYVVDDERVEAWPRDRRTYGCG